MVGTLELLLEKNDMNIIENSIIQKNLDSLIFDYGVDPEYIFNGVRGVAIGSKSYDAIDLIQIAQNLQVDAVNLFNGNFSKSQITKTFLNENDVISPDHLLSNAFSSTTSFNTLLVEAEKFGRREYLLRKLQIDESYLDSHRPLSVFACRNALIEMKPFFSHKALADLGRLNAKKFCTGAFGEAMRLSRSVPESLELFVHNSDIIEKNWTYEIKKRTLSSYILESKESELMNDSLRGELFTTDQLNVWRWSFLEEVLRIKTNRKVECKEISNKAGSVLVEVKLH